MNGWRLALRPRTHKRLLGLDPDGDLSGRKSKCGVGEWGLEINKARAGRRKEMGIVTEVDTELRLSVAGN